jgi:hypothetical protein
LEKLTLSFQVLLDGIILDFHVLHNSPETLDCVVQPGNDTRRSKLTESEEQHQSKRFDVVVVFERFEHSLDKCGKVNPREACTELNGQYVLLARAVEGITMVYLFVSWTSKLRSG